MHHTIVRMTAFGLLGMLICLALLTGMAAPPQGSNDNAYERWLAVGYGSYRISLRIEYRGTSCFQQLEIRAGQTPRAIRNTCEVVWLDMLSVPELFDLARQIESIPSERCMPSSANCICQRVFSARQIDYDQVSGYPAVIMSRSYVRPNWTRAEFWQNVIATGSLPNCGGPSPRRLTVQVVALTQITS